MLFCDINITFIVTFSVYGLQMVSTGDNYVEMCVSAGDRGDRGDRGDHTEKLMC